MELEISLSSTQFFAWCLLETEVSAEIYKSPAKTRISVFKTSSQLASQSSQLPPKTGGSQSIILEILT